MRTAPVLPKIPRLALSGAMAIAIKIGGAVLAYALVVTVAQVTDEAAFGIFGTAWSLYTLVSVVAILGQNAVLVRFWAGWKGRGDVRKANGHLCLSLALSAVGLFIASLVALLLALFPPSNYETSAWFALCATTLLLTAGNGWAEVMSGALRARGSIIGALAPRDIVWRTLSISVFAHVWLSGGQLNAVQALLVSGSILMALVLLQTIPILVALRRETSSPLSAPDFREHIDTTLGLWGVTSLPVIITQLNTVLVAALLGPIWAGMFFAAERSSQLFGLIANGLNQALAPQIARHYASGSIAKLQPILTAAAAAGGFVAIAGLGFYCLAGAGVLSLFSPQYDSITGVTVLIILGAGQAGAALCGMNNIVLQMTGAHYILLRILIWTGIVGTAALFLFTAAWGVIGAALATSGAVITWNLLAVVYSRRQRHLDPSILSLFVSRTRANETAT